MKSYVDPRLLNQALFSAGLLGQQQPAMVPGAPQPMSVRPQPAQQQPMNPQARPSALQGLLGNPEALYNISGGLLAAGAPTTDPGRASTMIGQTLQSTGGILAGKQKERQQEEAMQGLLGSGQFTPQQQALLSAFPQIGAQAAVQSAFTPGKQPGMVNMIKPDTMDVRTVPEGSQQQAELAQAGYALTGNVDIPKPDEGPSSYQEFAKAKADGFQGSYTDFLAFKGKSSATTIKNEGSIPVGYRMVRDAQGNPVNLEPIPGGPAALEVVAAQDAAAKNANLKTNQADIVNDDVKQSLMMIESQPDLMTGIMGSALSMVPGTPAHDLSQRLLGLQANMGFDKLQAMREASPTGGALGAVSENENKLLQSTYGSVAQSQSPEQLQYNLKRFYNVYNDIVHGKGNGPQRYDLGEQAGRQPQNQVFDYDPNTGELVPAGNGKTGTF
jgi:hypothetical protein